MNEQLGRILEGTFTLILVFLVITRADGFSTAIGAIGKLYQGSVSVLQGR